jgi:type IV pilus assembly protein PilE
MHRPSRRGIRHAVAGFTLIELLIAMVIAGVLAMIAVPAYQDSVRKSRRSEAFSALSTLQQAQERWRSSNPEYTATLSDLGASSPTPSGYYDITLAAPTAASSALRTGYIATATAVSGTSQASDTACAKLAVRMLDGNLSYCGVDASASCTFTERNACWVR